MFSQIINPLKYDLRQMHIFCVSTYIYIHLSIFFFPFFFIPIKSEFSFFCYLDGFSFFFFFLIQIHKGQFITHSNSSGQSFIIFLVTVSPRPNSCRVTQRGSCDTCTCGDALQGRNSELRERKSFKMDNKPAWSLPYREALFLL